MTMRGTCRRACLSSEERIWVGVATEKAVGVGLAREIAEGRVAATAEVVEVLGARESGVVKSGSEIAVVEAEEAAGWEAAGEAAGEAGEIGEAARSKSI